MTSIVCVCGNSYVWNVVVAYIRLLLVIVMQGLVLLLHTSQVYSINLSWETGYFD